MNNLLKKLMIVVIIVLAASSITCFSANLIVSPKTNPYKNEFTKLKVREDDTTVFNFKFKNKVWTYKVEPPKSNEQFDIDYELNKYNKNNKQQKIILIKYMKSLGFDNKIIINYLFPNLLNKIDKIKNNIEKMPKNAEIKVVSDKNIRIIKEIVGIKLNCNLFFENILNNYENNNEININVPINYINPEITYDDLKKCTNLRASFSTSFTNSISDRKHNIRQAAKKINEYILEPNEEFSFNKVVGKRTAENGYRVAKIIYNGNFIDGVGGGVCQVSSTLYNAVLLAGLNVKKSSKHSERISYVKAGFDAMVNYGSSDLVFENNTNNKIYIIMNARNDKLTVSIFGENLNGYQYKLRNEIVDVVPCKAEEVIVDKNGEYLDKVVYSDEYYYLKKASSGCTVKSYREVYNNGNLIKTELLRSDKYLPQHAIKVIGAKQRPSERYIGGKNMFYQTYSDNCG